MPNEDVKKVGNRQILIETDGSVINITKMEVFSILELEGIFNSILSNMRKGTVKNNKDTNGKKQ